MKNRSEKHQEILTELNNLNTTNAEVILLAQLAIYMLCYGSVSFQWPMRCTINSKVNGTPKGVYLLISKIHSILAVSNLLANSNLWYIIMYLSKFGATKIEFYFEMGK